MYGTIIDPYIRGLGILPDPYREGQYNGWQETTGIVPYNSVDKCPFAPTERYVYRLPMPLIPALQF